MMRSLLLMMWIVICGSVLADNESDVITLAAKDDVKLSLLDNSDGAKPCVYDDLPRPTVLLSSALLDSLKADVKSLRWKSELYNQVVKNNAELWSVRDIVIPQRSGHYHNFFCSDGTRLEVPSDQKFMTSEYRCPACGKVYSGEKYDGGRRWFEHNWLVYACRDLALAGLVDGKSQYLIKSAEILRKYADAYPDRHTSAIVGGIMYQSLCEAVMMIPLAQAYDMIYDTIALSYSDKSHIENDLFWESGHGLKNCGIGGNWGSWHLAAVGVIGMATRNQLFIDYAKDSFESQIKNQLGSDGLWPESVHSYHFYPLQAFVQLAEAYSNSGIDLYNWIAPNGKSLRGMFIAPLGYVYPDMRIPAINDGWYDTFLPGEHYEAAYYRYRLPELCVALKKIYTKADRGYIEDMYVSLWGLILGQDLECDASEFVFNSTNYSNIGICTLRNGGEKEIMMTFDYGRFLGHGQFDKMGITLYANNTILSADYGTPGYGSAIMPYYTGSLSHNVVIVDKSNQQKSTEGMLSVFHDSPGFKVAVSSTDQVYPGVTWQRSVFLTDGYAVVVDQLDSPDEHTYDWVFHSEGDSLNIENCTADVGLKSTLGYSYLSDVQGYKPSIKSNRGYLQWQFDGRNDGLKMEFLTRPNDEIFTVKCPAETAARKVPMVVIRNRGTRCRFITLLFPYAEQPAIQAEMICLRDSLVDIAFGEFNDRISFRGNIYYQRKLGNQTVNYITLP